MTSKIQPDTLREKSTKEIQSFINDQKKELRNLFGEEPGSNYPMQPSESIGTIKRNIARAKTILNERLDNKVN